MDSTCWDQLDIAKHFGYVKSPTNNSETRRTITPDRRPRPPTTRLYKQGYMSGMPTFIVFAGAGLFSVKKGPGTITSNPNQLLPLDAAANTYALSEVLSQHNISTTAPATSTPAAFQLDQTCSSKGMYVIRACLLAENQRPSTGVASRTIDIRSLSLELLLAVIRRICTLR